MSEGSVQRQRVLGVLDDHLRAPTAEDLDRPGPADRRPRRAHDLDDRAIQVLQDLLKSALAAGRTIIMSTHQLREALVLASDVALINRGKLAYRGPRTWEMLEDPGWLYRHYGEA